MTTPSIRVYLLGTGGPELSPDRQGAATLVEAGGQRLLFDAGRGVLQRLYECRVDISSVQRVFLTHLHSDHIEGLPGLWMTGWFIGGRQHPLEVHGPLGTHTMIDGMKAMYAHDMACRGGPTPKINLTQVDVSEFVQGKVFEQGGVTVTAFQVEHCDGNPAVGFRIDCAGASVVISGDTIYTDSLVRHARGADVVIHNVIAASEAYLTRFPTKQRVLKKLASPEECARVFRETATRLAVYTHVITLDVTTEDIVTRTRQAGYDGQLHVAHDRTLIDIGEEISVYETASLEGLPDLTCPEESVLNACDPLAGDVTRRLFTKLLG